MKWLRNVFLLLVFISVLFRYNRFFSHQGFWNVRDRAPMSGRTSEHALRVRYSPSVLSQSKELPSGTLPRHDLTPGAIDPRVTPQNIGSTICRPGYSSSVRPPFKYTNAMKRRLMRAYGVTGSIHDYELDHLIQLGLGGCPNCESNLWPQPRNKYPGAEEKDQVEDYLHHQVCSGALQLTDAQRKIASNWYAVYERIHGRAANARSKREQ